MTTAQATRPAPFTYETLDAYLGLAYSRALVTNTVERRRDGSIRVVSADGTVLLSYERHSHDFRFHVTYRLRSTGEARTALLCGCGAYRPT